MPMEISACSKVLQITPRICMSHCFKRAKEIYFLIHNHFPQKSLLVSTKKPLIFPKNTSHGHTNTLLLFFLKQWQTKHVFPQNSRVTCFYFFLLFLFKMPLFLLMRSCYVPHHHEPYLACYGQVSRSAIFPVEQSLLKWVERQLKPVKSTSRH